MAATVAVRYDPALATFRDRLRQRGHANASALAAVMHKLLRRMMGKLRTFAAAQEASALPLAA